MNAYDEFRAQFDTDEAAARAALDQLLESTGWGNAVMLQLIRLRKVVDLNGNWFRISARQALIDRILAEPIPQPVDISNHFTDMVKDLQCQVRELEVANAALQARMGDAVASGIDLAAERMKICMCIHCKQKSDRLFDFAEDYRQHRAAVIDGPEDSHDTGDLNQHLS